MDKGNACTVCVEVMGTRLGRIRVRECDPAVEAKEVRYLSGKKIVELWNCGNNQFGIAQLSVPDTFIVNNGFSLNFIIALSAFQSNEHTTLHQPACLAVLMLAANMRVSSTDSAMSGFKVFASRYSEKTITLSQVRVSDNSFITILSLWMKSFRDSASTASA